MIGTGMGRAAIEHERQARTWQLKLEQGGLAHEELEAFGTWMATPEHAAAYADCEYSAAAVAALDLRADPQWEAWKHEAVRRARGGGPKVEPLADWSDLVFSPSADRRGVRRGYLRQVVAVAACLAVLGLAISWQRLAPTPVLHYQAADAMREVLLPDGTRLTLDAGTSVDYVRHGGVRRLSLPSGRVYLQVARDPGGERFIVRSGEVETVVLGTRFVVSQRGARTEVVLEEGKVRMQRPGTSLATVLAPGQRGWWSGDGNGFLTAAATPAAALAWTRGRLMFEDVALADAIVEVNRYSPQMRIELADPQVGRLRVSGSYLAGDAELVVAAWEATLPVQAQHFGDRISLRSR